MLFRPISSRLKPLSSSKELIPFNFLNESIDILNASIDQIHGGWGECVQMCGDEIRDAWIVDAHAHKHAASIRMMCIITRVDL